MKYIFSSSIVVALVLCATSVDAYFKSPAQLSRNVSRDHAVFTSVDVPEGWPSWIGVDGSDADYRFMPSYYYDELNLIRATEYGDWPSWIGRVRFW